MANTRGIRTHMKSVGSIQKITKAMEMVAAARLHKAKARAITGAPFAEKIQEMLSLAVSDKSVMANLDHTQHPLLEERHVYKTAYLIVGSDRGLAGSYNTNVLKHAMTELKDKETVIIAVGRQMEVGLKHFGYTYQHSFTGFSDQPTFEEADEIASFVEDLFIHGEVDEVNIVYTYFKSALDLKPKTGQLLPVRAFGTEDETGEGHRELDVQEADKDEFAKLLYEPAPEEMLKYLVRYYIRSLIYTALVEGAACELAARMTAMSSATENAQDLLSRLEVSYNKARQAGITNEINEIVGGAEALQ